VGSWMNHFTRLYIPKEYNDYFYLDMLSVHPHYRGYSIFNTEEFADAKLDGRYG
jgi:hypothetical protein